MSVHSKITSVIGLAAGWLLSIFSRRRGQPTNEDLRRAEFRTSTQRMGVRFTERIRQVFRFKWLKKI